jgi:hypothetical protein
MYSPILLLCGDSGCGKDSAADLLVRDHNAVKIAQADPIKRIAKSLFGFSNEQLWGPSELRNAVDKRLESGFIFKDISDAKLDNLPFSDRLRDCINSWYATENYKPTPRFFLQAIGALGREHDLDIWADDAKMVADSVLSGYYDYSPEDGLTARQSYKSVSYAVISDGRYANEILKIRKSNGMAIKLVRNENSSSTATSGIANHSSEIDLGAIPRHFYTHILYNNSSLNELGQLLNDLLYANNLDQTILGTRYSGK